LKDDVIVMDIPSILFVAGKRAGIVTAINPADAGCVCVRCSGGAICADHFVVPPRAGPPMTLKTRIIPCLDVKDGRVVKGVKFVDLVDAGDPVEAAKAYDAAGADELCFLDITASHEAAAPSSTSSRRTAEQPASCRSPSAAACARSTTSAALLAGADKVAINTAAVNRRASSRRAAEKFGDQCIVVAIDAKQVSRPGEADRWEIFTHGGRNADRHRRDRLRPRGRGARRRRDPAHLDGPRRHQVRLRHRA
jgi:ketosteroid isomerase-like protein